MKEAEAEAKEQETKEQETKETEVKEQKVKEVKLKEAEVEKTEVAEAEENKLGTMSVNKLLLSTSLPMVISMLVLALYNVVDSFFVGKYDPTGVGVAALSYAFPIQNLMTAFSVGTGVGVNALLSKSLGEKNKELVNKTANNAVLIYAATFLLIALLGLFLPEPIFRMQNASEKAIYYGMEYLPIIMYCSFGVFAQGCMERLLISTGRTVYSMITQLTGAVVNIILDPILIFGYLGMPAMGVKGAAVATVVGQTVAALLGILFNRKYNPEIKLSFRMMKPDWWVIRNIYKVGFPSIIMNSISSVMVFAMNYILNVFSEAAVTAFGLYFKLQSFVFMPVFGMNSGVVPIEAYNYGAGRPDRIRKTIRYAVFYAVGIMLVGLILFETIPTQLLELFTEEKQVISLGTTALRIIAIHFPLAGVSIMFMSSLQALGRPIRSLLVSVARQLVVLVPCAKLLSLTGNLDLVWLAFPIAELVSLTLVSIFLAGTMKEIKKELSEGQTAET